MTAALMDAPVRQSELIPDLSQWLLAVCKQVPVAEAAGLYGVDAATQQLVQLMSWPAGRNLPQAGDLVAALLRDGGSAMRTLDAQHCLIGHAHLAADGNRGVLVLQLHLPQQEHRPLVELTANVARTAWEALLINHSGAAALRPDSPSPASMAQHAVADVNAAVAIEWNEVVAVSSAMLAQTDLDAAALAMCALVADRFACERVSIGMLESDGLARVNACAPVFDLQRSRSLVRTIEAAMDECAAQEQAVNIPQPDGEAPRIVVAHLALGAEARAPALLSMPLPGRAHADDAPACGVITLMRSSGAPYSADEIARLQRIASVAGPTLALLRDARASRLRRWLAAAADHLKRSGLAPKRVAIGGLLATAVFLGAACVVPVDYRISAAARVEGVIQRALVAPVDGFIKTAHVRPGDVVKEGTLLAEMARDDLLMAERRWAGELAQAEGSLGAAMATHDRSQVVVQQARTEESGAQLALVRQQIERSSVIAPFDGLIIEGDLSQSLGAPVKRGDVLMRIAPQGGWRVIVEVNERDIANVALGAKGVLVLSAQPGKSIALRITRITPVAASHDGRTFYEVEAEPSRGTVALAPGMTGVARVDAGQRTLGWIWTHRLFDAARYALWTFIG